MPVIGARRDSVVSNLPVAIPTRAAAWAPDGSRGFATSAISGTPSVIDGRIHELRSIGWIGASRASSDLQLRAAARARGEWRADSSNPVR